MQEHPRRMERMSTGVGPGLRSKPSRGEKGILVKEGGAAKVEDQLNPGA